MEKFSHALSSKPEAVRRQEPEGDPLGDLGELLREAQGNCIYIHLYKLEIYSSSL